MKRLIAIGVRDSWDSGWQAAHGNERAVVAGPIGKEERVWLEAVDCNGVSCRILLSARPAPLVDVQRYRVVKQSCGEAEPTTVEMILSSNGKVT